MADKVIAGDRIDKVVERICRYVEALQETYLRLRQMDHPKVRIASGKEKAWEQCAADLLVANANPHAYMAFTYDSYRSKGIDVYVEMVTSTKAVRAYLDQRPNEIRAIELKVRLMKDTVHTQLGMGRTIREILLDQTLSLGVVFRYALACSSKELDLAAQFCDDAEEELLYRPEYLDLLGRWLPERSKAKCSPQLF
jgi:hypothetical protein